LLLQKDITDIASAKGYNQLLQMFL